jgi:hypothetical protein
MKQFIRHLLVFILTCLLGACIVVFAERVILNKQNHFVLPLEKKYVFLGHSHAQAAYNDKLIDSALNLSSSGEAYFYTYIKLRKILESNSDQKVVFIEYANNNIFPVMNDWIWDDIHIQDRYKLYSAYANLNETKFLFSKNPKSTLVSNIKSLVNNVYYIFSLKNISVDQKMGGYESLIRDKTDSLLNALSTKTRQVTIDTAVSAANISYLKKMIDACQKKGVKVYLIRSPLHPQYEGFQNEAIFKEILRNQLQSAELLDFSCYPLLNSEFGDLEHTNYKGAKKYSLFINKLLKSGLLEKSSKQKFIDEQIAGERAVQ